MSRAASLPSTRAAASGDTVSKIGSMPQSSRHSTRVSPADVRELVSSPIRLTSSSGTRVKSATDATSPLEMMPRPGTIRYATGPRRYSIDGIIPRSISPACSSVAHFDGTSKRRSNRSLRLSSPDTSGRALRYPTAPSRTFFMSLSHSPFNTLCIWHSAFGIDDCLEPPIPFERFKARGGDVAADLLNRTAASPENALERRNAIHIVGAHRQRDLRELRAVERPVHLDRVDVGREQPRHRNHLDIVIARRGMRDGSHARKRCERAYA